MATITNNVRWADNTQELKANLLAGIGTIDAMKSSVDRTVASLGGQGLFGAANKLSAAIIEMGGVTKLTRAEQDRVNTTLEKAIEKYKLMGMTAPPAMVAIADATKALREKQDFALASAQQFGAGVTEAMKQAEPPTTMLSGAVGKLSVAFVAMKVLQWGAELFQAAGHLQDLHERTEISVESLQRFGVIAEQSGSSIDAISTAVFQMGKRLAGGDASAAAAVAELGLNFDAIRAMAPEQAFQVLGEAVAALPDPMKQAELGAALFGRSVAELLPVFKHLKDETGPYLALTGQQVELLDSLGDAYARLKASIVPAIVNWADAKFHLSDVNAEIQHAIALFQAFRGEIGTLPEVQGRSTDAVKKYNDEMARRGSLGIPDQVKREKDTIAELDKELEKSKQLAKAAADEYKKLVDHMRQIEGTRAEFKIVALDQALLNVGIHSAREVNPEIVKMLTLLGEIETKAPGVGAAIQMVGKKLPPEISADLLDVLGKLEKVETKYGDIGKAIQNVGLVGKPTMEDLTRQGIGLHDKGLSPLSTALGQLGTDFTQLATIGGDSFGGIARDIGTAVKAADSLVKSIEAFQKVSSTSGAGFGEQAAAAAAVGMSIIGIVAAIGQMIEAEAAARAKLQFAKDLARDFHTASTFSDALTESITNLHERLQTANIELTKTDLALAGIELAGVRFRSGVESISVNSIRGLTLVLAEALKVNEAIAEMGGIGSLTGAQMASVEEKIRTLFVLVKNDGPIGAQAIQTIDTALVNIGQQAIGANGLVSKFFLDMVEKAQKAGVVLPQVAAMMRQFGLDAASGFDAIVAGSANAFRGYADVAGAVDATAAAQKDAQKALDDLVKAGQGPGSMVSDTGLTALTVGTTAYYNALERVRTATNAHTNAIGHQASVAEQARGALNDLGIQAVASFAAAVASGTSFADALKAVHPGLQALRDAFKDLGISTNDAALQALFLQDAIVTNNPAAVAAVQGLVGESTALFNMGLLNADTFGAMERTGAQTYTALQAAAAAAGGGTRDALMPMQEWLHKAAEEAARLNIPLDDNTQQMIAQSQQLGIWQEKGPDAQQQMIDKTQTLVEKMTDVVTLLTGLVTDDPLGATADSASEVNTQLGGMLGALAAMPDDLPNPFRNWDLSDLQRQIDALSLGHSPGGIKEIPIQARRAEDAVADFTHSAIGDFDRVGPHVDALRDGIRDVIDAAFDPNWFDRPGDTGPETERQRAFRPSRDALPPVVSASRASTTDRAIAQPAASRAESRGGDVVVNVSFHSTVSNRDELHKFVNNDLIPEVQQALRDNRNGVRTSVRAALGVRG